MHFSACVCVHVCVNLSAAFSLSELFHLCIYIYKMVGDRDRRVGGGVGGKGSTSGSSSNSSSSSSGGSGGAGGPPAKLQEYWLVKVPTFALEVILYVFWVNFIRRKIEKGEGFSQGFSLHHVPLLSLLPHFFLHLSPFLGLEEETW